MDFLIRPRAPYDFARSMKFGTAPPLNLKPELFAPLLDFFIDGEYRRAFWAGDRPGPGGHAHAIPVLLRLRAEGSVERPVLRGATWPQRLGPAVQAEVEDAAGRITDAGAGLRQFYAAVARDPHLACLTAAFRGLKVFRSPSLFESLVAAVLEQQVNFNFAAQVKAALVARYGVRLEFRGRCYPVFPRPDRLANVPLADLRELKISGQKASYIRGLAQAAADGKLHVRNEPELEDLLGHKGVGPWTAAYVMIRVFGARDALPSNDIGLLRAAQRELHMRGKVTPARLVRRLQRFAGWRGYITWYLWHTEWEKPEIESLTH
jgi:DNA-3-methyladenine glycosylase II